VLVLSLGLLAACSGKEAKEKAQDPAPSTPAEAGLDAGPDAVVFYLPEQPPVDAGPAGPLSARLQINGQHASCGSCGVLIAQAQGGKPPYRYEWSDPSLLGPGPHSVCPSAPSRYSVKVTDSTQGSPEFPEPNMVVEATDELSCVDGDAGEVWGGCLPPGDPDAGPPVTICQTAEVRDPLLDTLLFEFPYSFSNALPAGDAALRPGKSYEFMWDQLLVTLNLGKAVKVTLYGADSPCGSEQKFGTWTLDGTPHQSFCFTPEKPWQYIRVDIDIGDTFFYFEFVPGVTTTCLGCSTDQTTRVP
jgi:hypothetical protein